MEVVDPVEFKDHGNSKMENITVSRIQGFALYVPWAQIAP